MILGAHYGSHGNESDGTFERGLHVTSLACRCGSLLAIPLSSLLMKWTDLAWRDVAGLAAWAAFGGVAVFYFYLSDSPGKVHDPQNPIRTLPNSIGDNDVAHRHSYHPSFHSWTPIHPTLSQRALNFISSVYHTAIPSIRAILLSRESVAAGLAVPLRRAAERRKQRRAGPSYRSASQAEVVWSCSASCEYSEKICDVSKARDVFSPADHFNHVLAGRFCSPENVITCSFAFQTARQCSN